MKITDTHPLLFFLYHKAGGEHFKLWHKDNRLKFLEPQAAF